MAEVRHSIDYKAPDGDEVSVPIIRTAGHELYAALKPPTAEPYIMAPAEMELQEVVDFFAERMQQVHDMRRDMLRRFSKSSYGKCRYQTGDVAYVLGRPFQLRVYPLNTGKVKGGVRGRTTSKHALDAGVSLLTLYVVHTKSYDESKTAFMSFAKSVVMRNAENILNTLSPRLLPGMKPPPLRMRELRGKMSAYEAGALWLSTELVPYPGDCLAYALASELEELSPLGSEEFRTALAEMQPGMEKARGLLSARPEPYCLQ